MNRWLVISALFFASTLIHAGTLMDASRKNHNPYLADRDGFDSLFVNPAGMAGQTDIFNLATEAGAWGHLDNIELVMNLSSVMAALSNPEKNITGNEVSNLMPNLASDVTQSTLDAILKDTSLEGKTLAEISNPSTLADWNSGNPVEVKADIKTMQENMANTDLQKQIMNEFRSINFHFDAAIRLGTLIGGIGFGLYTNAYSLLSVGALGIDDLIFEAGGLLGYGFHMGRFSFGFRGQYSILMTDDPTSTFSIDSSSLTAQFFKYGKAWGLDVGGIWEPLDGLRFGVLLNDLIGSKTRTEDMLGLTLANFTSGSLPDPDGGYNFLTDISMGLSWERPKGLIRPKLSLDVLDVVGMLRALEEDYTGVEQFYSKDATLVSRHLRVGGNVKFFNIIDLSASYYMDYFAFGLGFDLYLLELYGEVKTHNDFSNIGANIMIKIKF